MTRSFVIRSLVVGAAALLMTLLPGCGGQTTAVGLGSATRPAVGSPAGMEENAVVHQVSAADLAAADSAEPIPGTSATLWVNGLGCPQCATNIDMQLKRVRSVTSVRTDLGEGKVYITLSGKNNPSPHTLSERTIDAGFTLVKLTQP
jgi:copper chaperone CopZ